MKTEFTTTLYKEEQIWTCNVVDYGTHAEIEVLFGKNGGKIQKKITIITDGKNIGKANETTYLEQAISEAKSKVNKQKDKLYTLSQASTTNPINKPTRPMLAQSYDKHAKKIKFPCYLQGKYDGLRSLFGCDSFISRQGKVFSVLSHLAGEASQLLGCVKNIIGHNQVMLDGELYTDNLNFQEIVSGIKRDEVNKLTTQIEYHVYDIVLLDTTYHDRLKIINEAFRLTKPTMLKNVLTHIINQSDEISTFHSTYVSSGKEGVMLRNADGLYTPDKRSYDLQKVKSFNDDEFEIIDWSVDKNNHAVFTCVTKAGDKFDVKPSGDNEIRDWYTDNADKLIGGMLTVKFFGYTTGEKSVPRFPVGVKVKNEYE